MTEIGSVPGVYPNQLYNPLARCLGLPLHAPVLPCVGCLLRKWPVPRCMHANKLLNNSACSVCI